MTFPRSITRFAVAALTVAGALVIPAVVQAAKSEDSAAVSKLLADTRAEAVELTRDSADLDAFTNSRLSWQTYASKAEMIKGHVNATGKLLAKLKDASSEASAWQRTAIGRIEPLLRELAANTERTIHHLNENSNRVHFPAFRDYARTNYELATQLETLIRNFVAYGESKDKFENLERTLEVSE